MRILGVLLVLASQVALARENADYDTPDNLGLWRFRGTTGEGLEYLRGNAQDPSTIILNSGLQVNVLRSGFGSENPNDIENCKARLVYRGELVDGDVFDMGSDDIKIQDIITGFQEGVLMMVEGDRWKLSMPAELGYGDVRKPKVRRTVRARGFPARAS